MTREDLTDLSILALAALCIAGIYRIHKILKPLPVHRRAWVQARKVVGR